MKYAVCLFIVLTFLNACNSARAARLRQENLFSLEFGETERQLNIFATRIGETKKNRIVMHDGFFYISNGQSSKVMLFNSYGDLLALFYNPENNPQPAILLPQSADGETVATMSAYRHNFISVGEIAVNSKQTLLVEDRVSKQQMIYDEKSAVMLNRIILRFSPSGEVLDYLGQEGVGGTPFPYVHSLWTTKHDDIVVVSRAANFWRVYGYSEQGEPLYNVLLPLNRMPVPDPKNIAILSNVIPGRSGNNLYLMLSYYTEDYDAETGAIYGLSFVTSRIYTMNLEEGAYTKFFDIPVVDGALYELIGISDSNNFFFVRMEKSTESELLVINENGKMRMRRTLTHPAFLSRFFSLTASGHLAAMHIHNTGVDIVLWRSDILQE